MYINNITNSTGKDTASQELALAGYYDRLLPTLVMTVIFSLVGTPGNILVLVVYPRSKMTSTQLLLCIMAMTDLLTAMVGIPFSVVIEWTGLHMRNVTFCKVYVLVNALCTTPGIFLIWGLSFIRYYIVCKPHTSSRHFIEAKVKPFCVFVALICLFFSVGFYIMFGKQSWSDKNMPGFFCNVSDQYKNSLFENIFFIILIMLVLLTVCSIIVTNCLIFQRIWKHQRTMPFYNIPDLTTTEVVENFHVKRESIRSDNLTPWSTSPTAIANEDWETSEGSNSIGVNECEMDCSEKPAEKTPKSRRCSLASVKSGGSMKAIYKSESTPRTQKDTENGKSPRISYNKDRRNRNKTGKKDHIPDNNKTQQLTLIMPYFPKRSYAPTHPRAINRTTLKLSIVSILYIFTYVPWLVIHLYMNNGEKIPQSCQHNLYKYVFNPGIQLIYLGSAANPLVYAFVDPKFRSGCKTLFRR